MKCYWCYECHDLLAGLYIAAETAGKAKKMYFDNDGMCDYVDIRARTDGFARASITKPAIYYGPCPELEQWGRFYCDEYGRRLDNFTGEPIEGNDE